MARRRQRHVAAPGGAARPAARASRCTCPVATRSPWASRVADPDLDRVEPDGLGEPRPSATRSRSRPAPRRSRASRRRAGCWCRRRSVDRDVGHLVRPDAQRRGVGDHGRRGGRVGAAVEHDLRLDVDQPAVARRRRARSASTPGAGARGRRTTPRGSTPSAPAGRCAAPACTRAPAWTGPRGRRTPRRRRPASAGPSPRAARGGAICCGRRAATGWRCTGRPRRRRPARRARTPGRGTPGPACRPRTRRSTTTSAVADAGRRAGSGRCRTRVAARDGSARPSTRGPRPGRR